MILKKTRRTPKFHTHETQPAEREIPLPQNKTRRTRNSPPTKQNPQNPEIPLQIISRKSNPLYTDFIHKPTCQAASTANYHITPPQQKTAYVRRDFTSLEEKYPTRRRNLRYADAVPHGPCQHVPAEVFP